MNSYTHPSTQGAFTLRVKVISSDIRKSEAALPTTSGLNDVADGDEYSCTVQSVHLLQERVKAAMDTASLSEAADDVLLLCAETFEDALLFFHLRLLEGKLFVCRPFLFPGAEVFLHLAEDETKAMYPKYAQAANEGNPYNITVLVTIGKDAQVFSHALRYRQKDNTSQHDCCRDLFMKEELQELCEGLKIHAANPTTNTHGRKE